MLELHENLSFVVLTTAGERAQHMGYRYLILKRGSSFKAFRTSEGFREWLKDTGLSIGDRRGKHYWAISGKYYTDSILKTEARKHLDSIRGERCAHLSNGQYTRGVITDRFGTKTIHYLNPNCHDREILPYVWK